MDFKFFFLLTASLRPIKCVMYVCLKFYDYNYGAEKIPRWKSKNDKIVSFIHITLVYSSYGFALIVWLKLSESHQRFSVCLYCKLASLNRVYKNLCVCGVSAIGQLHAASKEKVGWWQAADAPDRRRHIRQQNHGTRHQARVTDGFPCNTSVQSVWRRFSIQ